jgi:uncharacterized protein YrrD
MQQDDQAAPGLQQEQTQPGDQQQATDQQAPQPGVQQQAQPGAQPGAHPQTQQRWDTGGTFADQRDQWNNVGNIDDVIMTADGEIRGIIIDVGGFLGIGARTVMVDIDELFFVPDHQNGGGWFDDTADGFFVVAAMSEAELEALPEFEEAQLRAGVETRPRFDQRRQEPGGMMGQDGQVEHEEGRDLTAADQQADQPVQDQQAMQQDQQTTQQDQQAMQQPRTQAPEGYQMMEQEQRTADALMDADVYDGQNEQIGNVEDLVLAEDGQVTHVVLNVGGFLGIGDHRVALPIEEVDIFWSQQDDQVRIQVPMTQEQLEQMPEYDA